jgi:predicted TPR repeat methyltransferase
MQNLAFVAHQCHDQLAMITSPETLKDPKLLHQIARAYEHRGEIQRALEHYQAALHQAPDYIDAHHNLGQLFLKTNHPDAATKQFNNVLALNPQHANAHFYLGVAYLMQEQLAQAKSEFETMLENNPEHTDAITNLGVIALKQEQPQQAITHFTEALAFDETHESARNNLAATFMHHNRFENARTHYISLLETYPANLEYLYNAGVAEMTLGHLDTARTHFNNVLNQDPNHHASLTNLASIASRLDQSHDAMVYLKRAHAANPHDTSSRFMLDALTQETVQREASPEYTKNLFDNYALYYEQHMVETLAYHVPKHIARVLHRLVPQPVARALDLGCGTGLSGVVLRDLSAHLTGVDLSPNMLNVAREKTIYDELIEADINAYLNQTSTHYNLITAADVLPYLGCLDSLFASITASLEPHGLFLLTHEISTDTDWTLQTTARFAHHPTYLLRLAKQHNLSILHQTSLIARKHNDDDLPVMFYALQSN